MPSLWNVHGFPSTRVPIDVTALVSYILPPMICYFIVAILAITPQTRATRVAFWPVVALLALRAVVLVDVSLGKPERKMLDTCFVCSMFGIVIRTFDWTLANEPLVRHLRPANSAPSIIMDVLDLTTNLRGHGWNWSHGTYIPHETRPTSNRMAFVFSTFLSVVVHALVGGVFYNVFLSFLGVASITERSTIFDESLPPLVRYLRASIISTCTAFTAYAYMQMGYDLCTILAILFLGQDPAQWPPSFDAPWWATSLHEFWGRRWHQWCRRIFLLLGGYPLSIFLGHVGVVLGAFLASAAVHDMVLVSLDSKVDPWLMLVGFGMMGPGLLVERAFRHLTGKRVGGVWGWMWTMAWLILFGNVMVEGFARTAGRYNCSNLINMGFKSVQVLVERLVIDFDLWLHAI